MNLSMAHKISEHVDGLKRCEEEFERIENIRRYCICGGHAAITILSDKSFVLIPTECSEKVLQVVFDYWTKAKEQHEKRIASIQLEGGD